MLSLSGMDRKSGFLRAPGANTEEIGVMRMILMRTAPESVVVARIECCIASGASRTDSPAWSTCFAIAVQSHMFRVADHLRSISEAADETCARCAAALHASKLYPPAVIWYLFDRGVVAPAELSNPSEVLWSLAQPPPFWGDDPSSLDLHLLDRVLGSLVEVGGRFNLHGCTLQGIVRDNILVRGPLLGEVVDIFLRHMKAAGQLILGGRLAIEAALGDCLDAESISCLVRAVLSHTEDIRDLAKSPDRERGPLLHNMIDSALDSSHRHHSNPDPGFIGIVQMLVDREWPLEEKDAGNYTPLAEALERFLPPDGQQPLAPRYESWLDAKMKVAKVLLEAGADTRAPIGISDTPLIEQALRCPETLEKFRELCERARDVEWDDLWCVVPPELRELLLEYDRRRYGSTS